MSKGENATLLAAGERFHAVLACDLRDLRHRNATKPGYCSRAPRTELTGAFQADDFGTPISIAAGGVGRPKGVSTGQPVVPGRIDV